MEHEAAKVRQERPSNDKSKVGHQPKSKNKSSKKRGGRILKQQLDNVKGLDIFGQPILFTTGGSDKARTWPGAIATIFITLITLSFGYYKFVALYNYTETNITTVNHLFDLPSDFEYSDF